jgi:ATP-dependent helicase/nuclease subunit A
MNERPRTIPDGLVRVQIDASDPAVSAWVAANAGSGKTHVLAQRVIRLLLDGVDPAKILCITFTKAAAANMANRVFQELRRWTALDDPALDAAVRKISNRQPDADLRALARRLFALALETPGGLKVQTIHAFCTQLLHQFPFEADVAARFTVLDEAAEAQLLDRTNLGVLLDAAQAPEGPLGRALATAITHAADQTFKDVVAEAIRKRDRVRGWIERSGNLGAAIGELCGMLAVAPGDTLEALDTETTEGPLLPSAQWLTVAAVLDRGSKSDQSQAAFLRAAAVAGEERANLYRRLFLTAAGEPRQRIVTKGLESRHADLADRLCRERERVLRLLERRNAVACRDRTAALLTIADAVITRYRAEKDRRGLLDYDDLIDKTLALLGEERAAWVHYKLDRGVDHVLIDEAQDTSPKQWEIVRRLTAEFFAGAGARTIKRTIFAVGDEKQSIFSFQDAAPRAFADMERHFRTAHKAAGAEFIRREFKHSFRSGPNVLGAVDTVFKAQEIYVSVTSDPQGVPPHIALPDAAPGLVEIWPLITPDKKNEIEAWDAPFDALAETSPPLRLAAKIARTVAQWTEQGARAGDVLVLVRQRGPLFEAIIRALKEAGIAVAGADRLVLTEHIAVMDLMVLADALLLPQDDLALATVLKSPLFGLGDDDLFAIAWERKSPLRTALRAKAADNARFAEAAEKLDRYARWARQDTPFDFYARLLGPEHGRKRFLARLGHEADDALQEFLNLALDYEARETPSLQGFIAWLRAAKSDVKRDMEMARDEVRVMTVHGAKGLEAPTVILAETTTPPAGPPQRQPRLLTLANESVPPGAPARFVWAGLKATDFPLITDARDIARGEAADEYRRLLYVAMTRAIDRLVVCGITGEIKRPEGCWYDLVADALKPESCEEPADDGDGTVWRYRKTPAAAGTVSPALSPAAATAPIAPPSWLARDVATEQAPAEALSPSTAYDETAPRPAIRGTGAERRQALARGGLVHRLLQSLPDIARPSRPDAIRRFFARAGRDFGEEELARLAGQVTRVLDDPRFAELFVPGSRAEVPIVGRIARTGRPPIAVSGVVDRLAVTASAVLIADYKTNRPPPARPEDVPPAYIRQLALYRAVLGELYPGKPLKAALVWTEVPDLMEISPTAMARELAAVTSP